MTQQDGVDKLKLVNNLYSILNSYTSRINASLIADTGASGYYLKADAPHNLASWPVATIQVKQPNVQILHSTKGCILALATLPEGGIESHIHTGLAHISTISIGKLCDAGCEASFNQHTMSVAKDEQVLLQGTRDVMTGLCRVPFQILDRTTHQSNRLHQVNGKENSIKYLHVEAFIPVQDTWGNPSIGVSSTHGRYSRQKTYIR